MESLLRIFEISNCIQDFLVAKDWTDVQPKDLMGELVEKGFFLKDHKEGQPLKKMLRDLDSENKLYLMPQVKAERKEIYTYWHFIYVNDNDFALAIQKIHKMLMSLTENDRYYSWRHCFNAFKDLNNDGNDDFLALNLGFFLASWGMYRGSAGLLQKDYKVHIEAVKILRDYHTLRCEEGDDVELKDSYQMIKLIEALKLHYGGLTFINGRNEVKQINPTDTLISKILLGTLACTPAYDTYFLAGVNVHNEQFMDLKEGSVNGVLKFVKDKKKELKQIQRMIQEEFDIFYPIMKIIDLYFWNEGYIGSLIKSSTL